MTLRWWMLGLALVMSCNKADEDVDKDKTKTEDDKKKKGEGGSKCKKDGDCQDGQLCEEKVCVPEAVAKKARSASSSKTASDEPKPADPAPSAAPATDPGGTNTPPAAACGPEKEVPVIPDTESTVPTLEEWKNACDINTQGPNSEAENCTMRILREWLQVTCQGDIIRHEEMDSFGKEGHDYFKQVSGSVAAFVVRLKKNRNPKVRICRKDDRASLFVSWPPGKDRPTIIALGRGAKCD